MSKTAMIMVAGALVAALAPLGIRLRAMTIERGEATMTQRLLTLIVLGLASMLASPAAASGSRDFTACMARIQPKEAARLLQADDERDAHQAFRHLSQNDYCFSRVFGTSSFVPRDAALSIGIMRGDLAELALMREAGPLALQPLPAKTGNYVRPWFAATGRPTAVDEMAVCMADTHPADIAGLVRTGLGSWEERAWMSNLPARLTQCLTTGVRLDADWRSLRAALADALYQRIHQSGSSTATSEHSG